MTRRKTINELRSEIMASDKLKAKSQDEICRLLKINQATVSRIRRGKFKRYSGAVARLCTYADISCMTARPLGELEASIDRLTLLATGGSTHERHALKLIRLAAELLKSEVGETTPTRRGRAVS